MPYDSNINPSTKTAKQIAGNHAEAMAKAFLLEKGLNFLYHQYRTKTGEIDLIMQDKNEIVFVEVRFRDRNTLVDPLDTITYAKRQKLIRTALCFAQTHPWISAFSQRFDVICISGNELNSKISWIPNAFGVE